MGEIDRDFEDARIAAGRAPPYSGTVTHDFRFAPIPYGSRLRNDCVSAIHRDLARFKFLFWGEVEVIWTLYLDEKRRRETDELADLDNYSKLLDDALKGSEGILIDDSQIQSLRISWVDTVESPYFRLELRAHPDEFLESPIELFEMTNGLYYPLPTSIHDEHRALLLWTLFDTIGGVRKFRRSLREAGVPQRRAEWAAGSGMPILTGLHKSRVVDAGFRLLDLPVWQSSSSRPSV